MSAATFLGYPRADGRAGIRNHLLVLPTTDALNRAVELAGERVTGAVVVPQDSTTEGGHNELQLRTLTGFASNPNVGHVILVGMGDEVDPGDILLERIAATGASVELLTLLGCGGLTALVDAIAESAQHRLPALTAVERSPVPLAQLIVGCECGGSDAYSGLTANPALGFAMDSLVGEGGTAMLCEMPELIGAEHIVAARAIDDGVAADVIAAVHGWEQLVVDFGIDLRGAQPSPGNQAGGLTTIEEKSLGAIAKGGHTPVVEVVGYGMAPSRHGLVLMDTPGQDVEQLTAMVAGGAQLIVFTTGRGTPTASPLAPTLKVSTNRRIAERMPDHFDVDASAIATGAATPESVGAEIHAAILAVAAGRTTAAERFGQHDFALPRTSSSFTDSRL